MDRTTTSDYCNVFIFIVDVETKNDQQLQLSRWQYFWSEFTYVQHHC